MDRIIPAQPQPSRARWLPCTSACYQTLRWPATAASASALAEPRQRRAGALAPSARLPVLEAPPHRLLALCDESGLRELVLRHMERLRMTPLFARSGKCFDCVAMRVADYVVESCGGPLYYSERHARLQAGAGLPLLLDEEGRELWLVQLWHAFDDVGLPAGLRADFWGWAEPLSIHMLTPGARHAAVRRYPYATVSGWFANSAPEPADGRATSAHAARG